MNTPQPIKYSNYTRPKVTYQDQLDEDQINEKLLDYIEVDSIVTVPINTHVRYYVIDTDEKTGKITKSFRLGGFLSNKDKAEQYVILTNNKISWSVNTQKAIFYRKLKSDEIYAKFYDRVNLLENENNELKNLVKEKNETIQKLLKKLEKYKK